MFVSLLHGSFGRPGTYNRHKHGRERRGMGEASASDLCNSPPKRGKGEIGSFQILRKQIWVLPEQSGEYTSVGTVEDGLVNGTQCADHPAKRGRPFWDENTPQIKPAHMHASKYAFE